MSLAPSLAPGFDDPVDGAQTAFRATLQALSRPGDIVPLQGIEKAPGPLTPALAAVALTLLDHETGVFLAPPFDDPVVGDFLTFHTGARILDAAGPADFLICRTGTEFPVLDHLKQGTADYPDRSATLLVAVDEFGTGEGVTLSGPGIDGETEFSAAPLDDAFWVAARRNHVRYPLGVDFLLCAPHAVAGLPRSTRIGT